MSLQAPEFLTYFMIQKHVINTCKPTECQFSAVVVVNEPNSKVHETCMPNETASKVKHFAFTVLHSQQLSVDIVCISFLVSCYLCLSVFHICYIILLISNIMFTIFTLKLLRQICSCCPHVGRHSEYQRKLRSKQAYHIMD